MSDLIFIFLITIFLFFFFSLSSLTILFNPKVTRFVKDTKMNRRLLELEDFESSRSQSVSERRLSYNFDPNEQVPSYESSQLLHRNLNTPIISRHASVVDNTRIAQLSTDLTQIRHSDDTDIRPPPPLVEEGADVGGGSTPSPPSASSFTQLDRRSLKRLGLKFLNARQHFLLACCRDLSLIPCFWG